MGINSSLENASEQDINQYATSLPLDEINESMRSLALYFKFANRPSLQQSASSTRSQRIEKTRSAFKLCDFRGIDPQVILHLLAAGITNVDQMLQAGRSSQDRQQLAQSTDLPVANILELVKSSDLSRLGGVKGIRARLYYDAGVDTPQKIAAWEPEGLRTLLADYMDRSKFEGIAPLPMEVNNTVKAARELPLLMEYESQDRAKHPEHS